MRGKVGRDGRILRDTSTNIVAQPLAARATVRNARDVKKKLVDGALLVLWQLTKCR